MESHEKKPKLMALLPSSGRGKWLFDLVCEELGIPKNARWVEVRFAMGEPISVRCDYLPRRPNPEPGELS